MSIFKLKKGLDIKLAGKADEKITELQLSEFYAIKPSDFRNLTPKTVAKEGDKVKAGSVIFQDKYNPNIVFTSPVSGELAEIKRGERRKILEFIIKADKTQEYIEFKSGKAEDFSAEEIKEQLIQSGLWVKIVKRPYGVIPKPDQTPRAIHIPTFDSAPLAPNYNFTLKNNIEEFQAGVNILSKLTTGEVHVNVDAKIQNNIFVDVRNAKVNMFSGPHPAGNVSTQINLVTPIMKGDIVWTVNPQDVVFIGRLFLTGKLDLTKAVALTGSEVKEPQYFKIISGAPIKDITIDKIKGQNVRFISGNVLSGAKVESNSFIGTFDNIITVIPEGDYYEMFGWAKPGFNRFSVSKAYFSWFRKKEWSLDTNIHGGVRSFVLTGKMDKVFPMNIMPMQLLKACYTDDIDMMEKLGIYEVIEEDFALCEFISETKMDFQEAVSKAITLMITEME